MEENILIKSEINKKAKIIFLSIVGGLFGVGVILLLRLAFMRWEGPYGAYGYNSGFEGAFTGYGECLALFIIAVITFVTGVSGLIIFWAHSKCSLTITEKNVKGKTLFGKEVVLPLYMISAYGTKPLFSAITVATASGITKFSFISNYAEIGSILASKINERQENTVIEEKKPAPQSNEMDDLVKLKSLLDAGIITQEEFDAKKKQLLGL